MFNKKKCKNCGKKINQSYDFCPYCGDNLKNPNNQPDWGMLGKDDIIGLEEIKMPMGLGTLFNSLVKNMDKQFREIERESNKKMKSQNIKQGGISINISTTGNFPPRIKIQEFGDRPKQKIVKEIKGKQINLPNEKIKELMKLPKKEPKTEMKRFSDSIVYELNIPGVNSIDNIAINKLENSIEIKAFGKKYIYVKIIPVNLPIKNYNLEEEKLILELKN
jgi:hypothetical protein